VAEVVIFQKCVDPAGTYNGNDCRHINYFTIPDNGAGTAAWTDRWFFDGDENFDLNMFGCGLNMSHDGNYALWNVGSQGQVQAYDPVEDTINYCVPNRESLFDHKGFLIGTCKVKSDPKVDRHTYVDSSEHSLRIIWVPPVLRKHSPKSGWNPWYGQVDHSSWYWANDMAYIVGHETSHAWAKGTDYIDFWGIWLNEWRTNKWTLMTPKGTRAFDPAIYVEDIPGTAVRRSRHPKFAVIHTLPRPVYDIFGRRIADSASELKRRNLPAGVYIAGSPASGHNSKILVER
jgi:hypothetical protein